MLFILKITKKIDVKCSHLILINPTETFHKRYVYFNLGYDEYIQILLFTWTKFQPKN